MKVKKTILKSQKWTSRVKKSERLQRGIKPSSNPGDGWDGNDPKIPKTRSGSRVKPNSYTNDLKDMLNSILKNENLTRGQKNRRAKQTLNTFKDTINMRTKAISAIGRATAENVVPTAVSAASATSTVAQSNALISGGADYSKNNTTDKRSDDDSTSYGDNR